MQLEAVEKDFQLQNDIKVLNRSLWLLCGIKVLKGIKATIQEAVDKLRDAGGLR